MPTLFTRRLVLLTTTLFALSACGSMPLLNSVEPPVAQPDVVVPELASADQQARPMLRAPLAVDVPDVKAANRTKFERAVVLLEAQDYVVAESLLLEVTADQPELAGPWVNLALSQLGLEKVDQANKSLSAALSANPHNCDARNQLGILAREQGDFEAAESHYRACLDANPGYAEAQLNLGILYELYMGRYSEALASYQDYQLALHEPNPTVNGWLLDLERRVAALAQR